MSIKGKEKCTVGGMKVQERGGKETQERGMGMQEKGLLARSGLL